MARTFDKLSDRILDLAVSLGIEMSDVWFCDPLSLGNIEYVSVDNGHKYPKLMEFISRAGDMIEESKKANPTSGCNIAEEATKLVCGDRNEQYGPPEQDYQRTAATWSGMLIHKLKPGEVIEAREAMLMMAGLKLCREMTKPKRDNRVDAIGYVLCEDWTVTGKKPTHSSETTK
jgi:hypothetical protein